MGRMDLLGLIVNVPEVREKTEKAPISGDVHSDYSKARWFETTGMSLGQLIGRLEQRKKILCGFQHELPICERPHEVYDCPHRQLNIVCAHLDAREMNYEKLLMQAIWLLELLGSEIDLENLKERYKNIFNELERLDIGARYGLDIPSRDERGPRGHSKMLELGVLEKRRSPKRPSREAVQALAGDIQNGLAEEMIFIRDSIVAALRDLAKGEVS